MTPAIDESSLRAESPSPTAIPWQFTGSSNTSRCLTYTRRNGCRLYTEAHILAIFFTCKKLLYAGGGMHPPHPPLCIRPCQPAWLCRVQIFWIHRHHSISLSEPCHYTDTKLKLKLSLRNVDWRRRIYLLDVSRPSPAHWLTTATAAAVFTPSQINCPAVNINNKVTFFGIKLLFQPKLHVQK